MKKELDTGTVSNSSPGAPFARGRAEETDRSGGRGDLAAARSTSTCAERAEASKRGFWETGAKAS